MKQWKRLAALSSAIVMAAATLTYFPSKRTKPRRRVFSCNRQWKIFP